MGIESLLSRLESGRPRTADTSDTSSKTPDVSAKSPPLLGYTADTSDTAEKVDTAWQRIAATCDRLSLPADLVRRQFDSWDYSADNIAEMNGWDDPTIEAHARLLLIEASERTKKS